MIETSSGYKRNTALISILTMRHGGIATVESSELRRLGLLYVVSLFGPLFLGGKPVSSGLSGLLFKYFRESRTFTVQASCDSSAFTYSSPVKRYHDHC